MRKLLSLFLLVFISIQFSQSQVPQSFNYQAVVRDASGNPLNNQSVAVIISIHQSTMDGTEVFTETHSVSTNDFGLINLKIGTVNSAAFALIDWGNGPYFIKVNVNGTELGGMQVLSVPYALHAKTAESLIGTITESDPIYGVSVASAITEADTTNWNTAHDWGNHSSENYLKTEIDGSVTNEIQDLTNVLNQGADANGSNISNLADPINDQDAVTKKYIQNLLVNLDLVPNNFEGFVTDYDGNLYQTVKIGTQIWMSENLTVIHYANGDEIPLVTDNNVWSNLM